MGERLRHLRDERNLTAIEVQFLLRRILPQSQWVNATTITRLETGETKKKIDFTLLAALCDVYDVRFEEEFPELVDDAAILVGLFDRHRPRAMSRDRRRAARSTRAGKAGPSGRADGPSACKVVPLRMPEESFVARAGELVGAA